MRTVTTKNGSYNVNYAWAPLMDGSCEICMNDTRLLSQIAPEFEGLDAIHFVDTDTGEYDYLGYTVLSGINRDSRGVHIKLIKEVNPNA
jgi:hypothetical protein